MIRYHLAMFYTGKLLAPGVKQGLKFYLNSPNFFPWGTNIAAKKQITLTNDDISVSLYLSTPILNPTLYNSLAKYRVKGKWPSIWARLVKAERLPSHETPPDERRRIFSLAGPQIVPLWGLVLSEAFNGGLGYYPICFQKFGVTRIKKMIGNEERPYSTPELNRTDEAKDYAGHHYMLITLTKTIKGGSTMIKPSDRGQGRYCTLYFWNNVPSGDDDSSLRNPRLTGDVRIEIEFAAAVNQNLTVIVFGEFEQVIEVDHRGGVI